MSKIFSVILAGGTGSGLWPLSRKLYPKQLIKVADDITLFQSTFYRLANCVDDKNIITVTNIANEIEVKNQLKSIKEKFLRTSDYKVVSEPVSKNTLPAIALSVKYIMDYINFNNDDPIIIAVPSDQIFIDIENFEDTINNAVELAKENYIVLLGSKKDSDELTGYIKTRKDKSISDIVSNALKVQSFYEKPDFENQKKLLQSKTCFINSGIYVFKASVFMAELKKHSPEILSVLENLELNKSLPNADLKNYEDFPNVSIDTALIEKSKKLAMVPLNSEWFDLGTWNAIYKISQKDSKGNYFAGKTVDINSSDTMSYSTSKLVTTIDLENTIVIETEDALLVCNKDNANSVKEIYDELLKNNPSCCEIHKTVYKPWGYYTVLDEGEGFLTKCIVVNPKAKLSVQLHHFRSEHWIVLEGKAFVVKGSDTIELESGESIDIALEEVHSLQNPYNEPLKIIEIQKGSNIDENDIERLEDIYGRV